jgi:hypothetical protein
MENPALTTIRGIVIPDEWDSKGRAYGVAIATYDEEKIPVLINSVGRQLFPLLRQRVIVKGILHEYGASASIDVKEIVIDRSPLSGVH